MPHKIAAYLRVSTEEQAIAIEGSLDNQRYHLRSFVDLKNRQEKDWGKVIEYYIDDGYSAKDTKRPAYQRMMTDLKKGKINLILIADLSRLSRNIHDFSSLLDSLDRLKAKFLSIKEQFDTSTPAGKMMIFNLINLAQFEREQVSERVSLGVHARGMRGLLHGGRPILGYDKHPDKPGVYILNPEEAVHVKTIFATFLKTGSRAKTIQQLELLGISPKINRNRKCGVRGEGWSSQSLGNLLNSATYLGFHEVNRGNKNEDQQRLKAVQRYQLVKASWPAIIDERTFSQTQVLLSEAKEMERTRLVGAETRVYLLSGILRCGSCGGPLVGKSSHGRKAVHRYYAHTVAGDTIKCGMSRVRADSIEKAVVTHLKAGLSDAGYFKRLSERIDGNQQKACVGHSKETARVKARLSELESQTANMFIMQGQQSMSGDALKMISDAIEKIAKEKRALTEHLESMSQSDFSSDSVKSSIQVVKDRLSDFTRGFLKATSTQKKRLLRRAIKQLVLTHDGLSIFFFLAEDDQTSGHKMQLGRDEGGKTSKSGNFFLINRDGGSAPKQLVAGASIGKSGDLDASCTHDLQFRKPLLYLSELRGHMKKTLIGITKIS